MKQSKASELARRKAYDKIFEGLKELGEDLNTVGNPDLTSYDHYILEHIKIIMDGYKNTY